MKPFDGRLLPVKSAPGLYAFNGTGTTLLGHLRPSSVSDRFFARRFFTVFWVPIFPLGIYLVSMVDSRTYRFHWQIAAHDFHRAYPAKVLWGFYGSAVALSIGLGVALVLTVLVISYAFSFAGFHGHGFVRVRL